MVDNKKDSPFVDYIKKCNGNMIVPSPTGIIGRKIQARNKVMTKGF